MMRSLVITLLFTGLFTACSNNNTNTTSLYNAEVLNANWLTGEFLSNPNVFILAGEHGSITYSSDGRTWNYSQTPTTNTLHDLEANDSQTVLIAVGEGGTIMRSTDHGKKWQLADISLPENLDFSLTRLNTVVYAHKSKSWLAAGTQNAILRSTDDGLSWDIVSINTRKDQIEILQLFVEEQSGDVLFAAQHATTGRTRDGGLTWNINKHDMGTYGSYIPHVVGFHQFNNTLIAAADSGRLLISKNAGLDWELATLPTNGYFTDSAYDPTSNTIALTTQMGEVAISNDEGNNWKLVSFDVNNWPSDDIPLLSNIVFDENSRSFLVVGNSGVIAMSDNGGHTWSADIYRPLFNLSVTTLLHNTKSDTFIIAGFSGVIVRAESLGGLSSPLDNWTIARPGIDQYIRKVLHLPNSNTFIAVGQLGSVWRSEDDGLSWKLINIDYPHKNQPPHLRDIIQDPNTLALIAAGPAGSIIRSSDNGANWSPVFQGEIHKGEAFTQLLYDKQINTYYACEVLYQSVYQSPDSGLSWNKIATINSDGRNLWRGVISNEPNLYILVGEKGAIAFSRDKGFSWKMAKTNSYADLYDVYVDSKERVLLAVGQNGVILKSGNGSDWIPVDSSTTSDLRRVIKDHNSGALIAFGQNGAIVLSTNSGQNWTKAKTPDYSGELRCAIIEYLTDSLIVVGQDGGVLRSTDSGKSWHLLDSHTNLHFRSATINPKTGTIISVGEGIVRLSRTPN
jgi:photosystem II stability/assembly factor-like uncharacterized protein